MRNIFGRSIVYNKQMQKGDRISELDLEYKKPAGGLRWEDHQKLVNKCLTRNVKKNDTAREEDVN